MVCVVLAPGVAGDVGAGDGRVVVVVVVGDPDVADGERPAVVGAGGAVLGAGGAHGGNALLVS